MENLVAAFQSILTPEILLIMLLATIIGIIGGATPGISGAMTLALFLPASYGMDTVGALTMMTAIYIGSMAGGLISAILLKIPGTPASVATTFDGAPMADRGEAVKALGTAMTFSFLGGVFGILILILSAPQLVKVTLQFSYYEYFAIGILSLTIISSVGNSSVIKSLIGAVIGFFISFVGRSATSPFPRYTMGFDELAGGFNIIVIMIGFYAVAQVFDAAFKRKENKDGRILQVKKIKGFGFTGKEFKSQLGNALYAACIGTGIGILPGVGGGVSNIAAYAAVKNRSKYPEKFGTGIMDGVVASETANNATVGGALIPLLTLGIPGDNATAIILAAFMVHGITPGPLLFQNNAVLVYVIFIAALIAHFLFLVIEYFGIRVFIKVLAIKQYTLLAVVSAVCIVGAYTISNRIFDIWSVLVFGILGYVLEKLNFSLSTVILGAIIGPIIEENYCRGMQRAMGDFTQFFTSPVATGIFVVIALIVIFQVVKLVKKQTKKRGKYHADNGTT